MCVCCFDNKGRGADSDVLAFLLNVIVFVGDVPLKVVSHRKSYSCSLKQYSLLQALLTVWQTCTSEWLFDFYYVHDDILHLLLNRT